MAEEAKKILQVDDEPDITYIVEFVLTNGGFEVTRLNDSSKAVDEMKKTAYTLLILDLMMPQMNGFQVLEAMRSDEQLKDMKVLILSSRQLTEEETEFLKNHGAHVMAKPFEPSRLLEKVREMVTD